VRVRVRVQCAYLSFGGWFALLQWLFGFGLVMIKMEIENKEP